MTDPMETRAPERIWAWTWDLLGYGRKHGAREWVSFLPKPFSVKRFVPTDKRWWQFLKDEEREVFQVVTEYIRADLVAALVAEAVAGALASCSHPHETHINRAALLEALGPEIAAAIRARTP